MDEGYMNNQGNPKGAGGESDKTRFLEATFEEVRKNREELSQKKEELQRRLDEIREKEKVATEEEGKIEGKLRDMLRIEAKYEEILGEEEILRRQEEFVEEDLLKVKQKLDKIKKLYESVEA